jgi:hypothetical protein
MQDVSSQTTRRLPSLVFCLIAAAVLLIIAAGHILPLDTLELDIDEVWSIWQGFGSPAEIIRWTPYDWPWLYYLTLAGWQRLVGLDPLALRYLSVLAFMPGAALMFRVLRRWTSVQAGLLGMLAYAALEYSLFLSTEVRGYALLLGFTPLALWLTIRYFDRPNWRRGIGLGVVLAAMFYTSFTSAVAFGMLGLVSIMLYGRAIWRWWLPGVVGGLLAAPLILDKLGLVASRTRATQTIELGSFVDAIPALFGSLLGERAVIWVGLLVLAAGLMIWQARQAGTMARRRMVAIALWGIGGPVLMYALNGVLGFFSPRYSWWIVIGLALWAGWGLAYLPALGRWAAGAILTGLLLFPGALNSYKIPEPPLIANLSWLADHAQPGDVLLLDPLVNCGSPEEWAYLSEVYLAQGPAFVEAADDHRRIWYAHVDTKEDPATLAAVAAGRIKREFVGPPECLIRLYEGPPDPAGIAFENGMRFHGMDMLDSPGPFTVRHEGDPLHVRLWWSVDESPEADYSIGLHLTGADGALLAQLDSGPQVPDAPGETSTWTTGRYYVEERTLDIPFPTVRSELSLYLVVYQWWDGVRIAAPGVDDNTALRLDSVYIASW